MLHEIVVNCPPMLVLRKGVKLFEAQELKSTGYISFSDRKVNFDLTFPKCLIRGFGIIGLTVDQVTATGITQEDDDIEITLEPEKVIRNWLVMVAQPVNATGVVGIGGQCFGIINMVFPACNSYWAGIGKFMVDAVTATGTVEYFHGCCWS